MIQPEDAIERWQQAWINDRVITAIMMEDERFEDVELEDSNHLYDVWSEFVAMLGGATMAMMQANGGKECFVVFPLPLVYEEDDEREF